MGIKISSNAGHSSPPGDPGACGSAQSKPLLNGQTEAMLARNMNSAFLAEGKRRGYDMHNGTQPNGSTANQAGTANKYGAVLAVSHHFDGSTNPAASGTMVLVHPNTTKKNKDMAKELSAAIAKAFGIPDRGAINRANLNFLNSTNMPAVLIEWAFISSPTDMKKVLSIGTTGINAAWDVIAKYYPVANPVVPPEPPKPVVPAPENPKESEEYKALLADYNALVVRYLKKEAEYVAVAKKLDEVAGDLNILLSKIK